MPHLASSKKYPEMSVHVTFKFTDKSEGCVTLIYSQQVSQERSLARCNAE